MGAVEVIYLTAAILWIGAVLAVLVVGIRVALTLRAKRRRINRIVGVIRLLRLEMPRETWGLMLRQAPVRSGPRRRHRQRL